MSPSFGFIVASIFILICIALLFLSIKRMALEVHIYKIQILNLIVAVVFWEETVRKFGLYSNGVGARAPRATPESLSAGKLALIRWSDVDGYETESITDVQKV